MVSRSVEALRVRTTFSETVGNARIETRNLHVAFSLEWQTNTRLGICNAEASDARGETPRAVVLASACLRVRVVVLESRRDSGNRGHRAREITLVQQGS